MSERPTVLVVDDEPNIPWLFEQHLGQDYHVLAAIDGKQAMDMLTREAVDLIMLDIRLAGENGLDLLHRIRQAGFSTPVIMITAYAAIRDAVGAIKAGAFDYVVKPFEMPEIRQVMTEALTVTPLRSRPEQDDLGQLSQLIIQGQAMQEVLQVVEQIADTDATVLLQGESGVGKELVARALHERSRRREKIFLPVNCAAFPENLLEAELFGYEPGAFTGATKSKPGKFELAGGGTLLLDEIGELPLGLQAKLLRVLEDKSVTRLGATRSIPVDVRIIAASNRDLYEQVQTGQFRKDLYYRLAVIPVYIPPLRERREEIVPLARYFLGEFSRKHSRASASLSSSACAALVSYGWPGNVRELRNLMERLAILFAGREVGLRDLPRYVREGVTEGGGAGEDVGKEKLAAEREKLERDLIVTALEKCGGNRTRAAEYLGVSRRWVQLKIKEYGIN